MRSLIQYDLDEPPAPRSVAPQPPTKKRKRNHHPHKSLPRPKAPRTIQHWDDPGNSNVGMVYDEQPSGSGDAPVSVPGVPKPASYGDGDDDYEDGDGDEEYDEAECDDEIGAEEEEEESRELTHGEIWDDSALIDAWNSAEAEYESYHGKSKDWKTEAVKKSPLWYNKPYTGPPTQAGPSKSKPPSTNAVAEERDTAPIDFHTFVPTHDPSLSTPADAVPPLPTTPTPFTMPQPSTMMVSRDEAFNNALSAMYWSGYWTAVYHCQSQSSGKNANVSGEATENGNIDADEYDEDLVPAQR